MGAVWSVLARALPSIIGFVGTASTGWFLSDWFNETNTTQQSQNGGNAPVKEDWWNQKRIIAVCLGALALIVWVRRGGLDKFKK